MSEIATKLLSEALGLSPDERFQVAQQLLDSLDGDFPVLDEPEFQAELQRRLDAVADGTAELVDGEQVFREARERLRQRHQQ
jgi:putative addiction module component (TIGR02574 family)